MMTSSNGTFSALLDLYAGKSPVTSEFPAQRPVTRSFDVFFDLRLTKRLSKQSWGWWFETLSRPLLRHCSVPRYLITAPGTISTTLFLLCFGPCYVIINTEAISIICSNVMYSKMIESYIYIYIYVCIYVIYISILSKTVGKITP